MGTLWDVINGIVLEDFSRRPPRLVMSINNGGDINRFREFTIKEAKYLGDSLYAWVELSEEHNNKPLDSIESLMIHLQQAKAIMTVKNIMPELSAQIDEALKKEAAKYSIDLGGLDDSNT